VGGPYILSARRIRRLSIGVLDVSCGQESVAFVDRSRMLVGLEHVNLLGKAFGGTYFHWLGHTCCISIDCRSQGNSRRD